MKITEGIGWILAPSKTFEQSVAFFRDVMGLPVTAEGVPVTDTQYSRYAQIRMPNGIVLEIVEPKEAVAHLYDAPVPSFTVDDLAEARRELERRHVEFVTPVFDTRRGRGWTYFRAPDGSIYQLQGPYREKLEERSPP